MFVYSYKPVYSLSILSDPNPLDDEALTTLSELLEPKFKLNIRKSKIKRKTKTELSFENNKSGLSQLFLEYVQDYGLSLSKKMSLKDRIKQFQDQYTPIHLVGSSNPVIRSLNSSSTISIDESNIRLSLQNIK